MAELIVALDVQTRDEAVAKINEIGDAVGFYKIGLELFTAEGPDVVKAVKDLGKKEVIDAYQPKYLLHGHVHMSYGMHIQREHEYHGTQVINVCEKFVIDIPKEECGAWRKPSFAERVKFFLKK